MARPPLVLGTWGKITRVKRATHWTAYARFRDYDGVTRQVERQGATGAAAERELLAALRDRARLPSEDLTPETRLNVVADAWREEFARLGRAEGTVRIYDRQLVLIRQSIGELQLRELTVPAVDRFLDALSVSSGPESARLSRVVLSAICKLAVRKGAMHANPVRDAGPTPRRVGTVRSVDVDDVTKLRAQLAAWDSGKDSGGRFRQTDLADPVDMILGTGMRTGEVFAVRWSDLALDADAPTVEVSGTVIFRKGEGYIRQDHVKSERSWRRLLLPLFVVEMLAIRRATSQGEYVFDSSTGTLRSPNNFRTQWRTFREAHEYESWMVPKTFRKAVATLVKRADGLELASAQLGHSGTAVTRKHYVEESHLGPDLRHTLQRFAI